MKACLTYFLLTLAFCVHGQNVSLKNLTNTEWAANNYDQSFYKSDTIKIYRITDSLSEFQKLNLLYRLIDYNNGRDITTIKLKREGRFRCLIIISKIGQTQN